MKKIVIFGTGKLTLKLVSGFCLAISQGKLLANIVVIGRNREKLEKFLKFSNVQTSTELTEASGADYCIICILPTGTQDLYQKLGKFFKENESPKTIISITSGVNVMRATELLKLPHASVVCGTINTNVCYCAGYSVFTGVHGNGSRLDDAVKLFSALGKAYSVKSYKNVEKCIGIVGSGNAFDAIYFWKLIQYLNRKFYFNSGKKILSSILNFLQRSLQNGAIRKDYLLKERKEKKVLNFALYYLETKVSYMISLGYEENVALQISIETTISTLTCLLKNPIDKEHITLHVKNVATEGGCTAKGLEELKLELSTNVFAHKLKVPDFTNFSKSYKKIMRPVHRRIKLFKKDALS